MNVDDCLSPLIKTKPATTSQGRRPMEVESESPNDL